MQIGMIGLGRMGASMTDRLMLGGHHCVVNDRDAAAIARQAAKGAAGASSLQELVAALAPPRADAAGGNRG